MLLVLRVVISTRNQLFAGGVCRFTPTCSEYAFEAFQKHNAFKALILVFIRLVKCNPFFFGGHDPVPNPKQ
jgi:putative membrane protein insertion efficiency factor